LLCMLMEERWKNSSHDKFETYNFDWESWSQL
jgi:hypothetical protein